MIHQIKITTTGNELSIAESLKALESYIEDIKRGLVIPYYAGSTKVEYRKDL